MREQVSPELLPPAPHLKGTDHRRQEIMRRTGFSPELLPPA
jgi:hypothetical protein